MARKGHPSGLQRMLTLAQSKPPEIDQQLLKHKDFSLNCSDLDVLSGRWCINSRIIDFYFSVLSEQSQCTRARRVVLVPSSVSSSIANSSSYDFERLYETVEKYGLREKELSIFVVDDLGDTSDNQTWRHWSLLVYVRKCNLFLHHDSCEEANEEHALKLYKILRPFLGCPKLEERNGTPQQMHLEDSGLFVMAIAREICAWFDSGPNLEQLWFNQLEKMNGVVADEMRKQLLELINMLMMDEDGVRDTPDSDYMESFLD